MKADAKERDAPPLEPIAINHMLADTYKWSPTDIDGLDEREASDYLTCIRLHGAAKNNAYERAREDAGKPEPTRKRRMTRLQLQKHEASARYPMAHPEAIAAMLCVEMIEDEAEAQ